MNSPFLRILVSVSATRGPLPLVLETCWIPWKTLELVPKLPGYMRDFCHNNTPTCLGVSWSLDSGRRKWYVPSQSAPRIRYRKANLTFRDGIETHTRLIPPLTNPANSKDRSR